MLRVSACSAVNRIACHGLDISPITVSRRGTLRATAGAPCFSLSRQDSVATVGAGTKHQYRQMSGGYFFPQAVNTWIDTISFKRLGILGNFLHELPIFRARKSLDTWKLLGIDNHPSKENVCFYSALVWSTVAERMREGNQEPSRQKLLSRLEK